MEPSERITWESCPLCERTAAVGWVGGRATEFDCPAGCRVTPEQVDDLATTAGPSSGSSTQP